MSRSVKVISRNEDKVRRARSCMNFGVIILITYG